MIGKKHLNKIVIGEYNSELSNTGYCIIDDFIDPDIYAQVEKELSLNDFHISKVHEHTSKKSKDVYMYGEQVFSLHNFFQSSKFLSFLSLIYMKKLNRNNYIDFLAMFPESSPIGGIVGQLYEKGCFFDWHTDGQHGDNSAGAFSYYLYNNDVNWKEEFGGCLELSDTLIIPERNRLVLLKKNIKHRVTKIKSYKNRVSLQSTLTYKLF